MRKLLFLIGLLFCGISAQAQSVINAANAKSAGGGNTLAVTISTTSGNLIVIIESQGLATTDNATPSDSAGNTYTLACSATSGAAETSMYYAKNAAAVTSVTANFINNPTNTGAIVNEVSGADTSSPLDGCVTSTGTAVSGSADETSGALTTANANDVLIYGVRVAGTNTSWAAGTGYTIPTNSSFTTVRAHAMQNQVVSATQSGVTAQITNTGSTASFVTVFAGFKKAAGGATPAAPNKRLKVEQFDGPDN